MDHASAPSSRSDGVHGVIVAAWMRISRDCECRFEFGGVWPAKPAARANGTIQSETNRLNARATRSDWIVPFTRGAARRPAELTRRVFLCVRLCVLGGLCGFFFWAALLKPAVVIAAGWSHHRSS